MNRFLLLVCTGMLIAACCSRKEPYFKMRGVVLAVEDIETVDWAKLAHDNGINTIGAHFTPNVFFMTEKGDDKYLTDYDHDIQFLKDYGAGLKNYEKKTEAGK